MKYKESPQSSRGDHHIHFVISPVRTIFFFPVIDIQLYSFHQALTSALLQSLGFLLSQTHPSLSLASCPLPSGLSPTYPHQSIQRSGTRSLRRSAHIWVFDTYCQTPITRPPCYTMFIFLRLFMIYTVTSYVGLLEWLPTISSFLCSTTTKP